MERPIHANGALQRGGGRMVMECKVIYHRPGTRGELRDSLKAGIICEVVTSVASWTAGMLIGWMWFSDFTTRPSENAGWTIFEPTK